MWRLHQFSRDARLKAAEDDVARALRAAADAAQRSTEAKLAANAAQAAATEAQLAANAAHAAVVAMEADVEAVTILDQVSRHRGMASPTINNDDIRVVADSPIVLQPSLSASNRSSALVSDPAARSALSPPSSHNRMSEQRTTSGESGWIEELDGPADSFPCGNNEHCGNGAQHGTEIPVGNNLQVCCFVRMRKRGVGAQLRAHYKGYPAKWNQWISAARARVLAPELAAACEAKSRGHPSNSLKRAAVDSEAKPSMSSPAQGPCSLRRSSARERYFRACLEQATLESQQEPLGPFGAASNERALEGSEIDSLLEHSIAHSHPTIRPHLRHLLACSIEQWEDIHWSHLLSMLSPSELGTPQAVLSSSSNPSASSPLVIILPLQISEDSTHHWVTLFIHTGSKEFVLIDSLQPPSLDQDGDVPMQSEDVDDLGPGREWLQPIQATLRRRLPASSFRQFRWRSLCLGVQTDDYSCGVWVAAILKEWIRLATSASRSSYTDDSGRDRPNRRLPSNQTASSTTHAHSEQNFPDLRHLSPRLCKDVDILTIRQESSTILYPSDADEVHHPL
jgi:hypothetical protein